MASSDISGWLWKETVTKPNHSSVLTFMGMLYIYWNNFSFPNLRHHDDHKVLLIDFVFFESRVIVEDFTCEETHKWVTDPLALPGVSSETTCGGGTIDGIIFNLWVGRRVVNRQLLSPHLGLFVVLFFWVSEKLMHTQNLEHVVSLWQCFTTKCGGII